MLYGWGKNAPAMSLPTGVGYSVGPGSAMQSLVLQVSFACHYAAFYKCRSFLSCAYFELIGYVWQVYSLYFSTTQHNAHQA